MAWEKHCTIINNASVKTVKDVTLTHDGFNTSSVQNCNTYIKHLRAREASMWTMNKMSDYIQTIYYPTRGNSFGCEVTSLGIWPMMFQTSTVVSSSMAYHITLMTMGTKHPLPASHPTTRILSTML
jgi:hypothetical protein